jgi:hypothetical protein
MSSGFVYKWIDNSNGMYYIGCHKGDVNDGYIGSGTYFKSAYKKRPESFVREVLYAGENYRELEEFILEELDAKNDKLSYNLKNSSEGGNTRSGKPVSEENRINLSKSKLGAKNPMYGVKIKDSHRLKLSNAKKGAKNPSALKLYCEYLNKEFKTLKDAALELGLSKSYCSRMLNGIKNNKYGLKRL